MKFIKVTDKRRDNTMYLNMDQVLNFFSVEDGTEVFLSTGARIIIKETPHEVFNRTVSKNAYTTTPHYDLDGATW